MSYRDDGFAALERAEFLQHELDRSRAENEALRERLAAAPSRDAINELEELRARLDLIERPQRSVAATQAFDAGLVVFLLMMVSMLVVAIIVAMH